MRVSRTESLMDKKLIAKASTTIQAPVAKVWDALVTPATIKQYMFGTTVAADFKKGSPITGKGEWQGRKHEDKGVILHLQPRRELADSHFSPLPGLPEKPDNFHHITIELVDKGKQTVVPVS